MVPDHRISGNGTSITAHFDAKTNKHRVDVTFSETVARLLAMPADGGRPCVDCGEPVDEDSVCLGPEREDDVGEFVSKKSEGSGINSAADHAYSVTVE